MIKIYEGQPIQFSSPSLSITQQEQADEQLPSIIATAENSLVSIPKINKPYPLTGEWKEKLFHAIKQIGKPATVREITQYIVDAEKSEDFSAIKNIVGSTLSTLSKKSEIVVDKSLHQHKYSLK